LDHYGGDIIPFDLGSGRVYMALTEITIGFTSAEADSRLAAGGQLPRPWSHSHQALTDTGSPHTVRQPSCVPTGSQSPVP
jgi:hypothetical protein